MSVSPVPMVRMHRRPPPMSDVVCVHMQAMTAPTKLRFGARVQFHAHGALDLDGVAIRTPSFQRMGIAPLPCVRHDGISHEEVPYGYLSTASNFFDSHCEHHGSVSAPLACFPEATMRRQERVLRAGPALRRAHQRARRRPHRLWLLGRHVGVPAHAEPARGCVSGRREGRRPHECGVGGFTQVEKVDDFEHTFRASALGTTADQDRAMDDRKSGDSAGVAV